MEHSREFYTQVIGLKFHDYRPQRDSMDLTDGTNNITLLQHPADAVRQPQVEGNEYIHFGIIVADLAGVWNRAKEWGAEISKGDVRNVLKLRTRMPCQNILLRFLIPTAT